jgi:hypothetical protein
MTGGSLLTGAGSTANVIERKISGDTGFFSNFDNIFVCSYRMVLPGYLLILMMLIKKGEVKASISVWLRKYFSSSFLSQ